MAQVRLKINMIISGKFVQRGTVMDEANVPENLRRPDYIDRDPLDRHGQVLLLRDLSFMSLPRPMSDDVPTSFPVHVAAGETLDLATLPPSARESLAEGSDYKREWSDEEPEQIRKAAAEAYLKQFETEPAVPAGYKSR